MVFEVGPLKAEALEIGDVWEEFLEEGDGFGALNGELSPMIRDVFDLAVPGTGVLLKPLEIFLGIGGIDAEEGFLGVEGVDDEVVDAASGGIAHGGVFCFGEKGLGEVVGEEGVEEGVGLGSGDEEFSHMGDIEEAYCVADGEVFFDDTGVLDGHFPAAEFDHAGVMGFVKVIERC